MKKHLCSLLLVVSILISGCQESDIAGYETEVQTRVNNPIFKGKLVYHNYTSYEAMDAKLWLYDFSTGSLEEISRTWNIRHPMNAHFSPDGRTIVFMGIGDTDSWDIFSYDLYGKEEPINLTAQSTLREEDPKFSPDGKKIVFKRDLRLAEMNLSTRSITMLTDGDKEYSMPYYNYNGTEVICSEGGKEMSSIVAVNVKTKEIRIICNEPGVQDYYPINADKESFFYSRGYSSSNRVDQVYRGFWNGRPGISLPFNESNADYSDAYPVDDEWLVISSTRAGSKGGYDLYLANVSTGSIQSLSDYHSGINSSKNELGAAVYMKKANEPVSNINLTHNGKCYYASVDLEENQEFEIPQVVNPATAYNRDFMEYNPATGNFVFKGESGTWEIFYYPKYNYIWVAKWSAVDPEAYWIIGSGFSSAPKWYNSFNSLGWDLKDERQVAYMKRIGNNKYQASIYLSNQTEWGFDIKMYGKRSWSAKYAIFANSRLKGDTKGMKVAGKDKADIVMDKGFKPGYFLVTVDLSSGLKKAVVDFKRIK